MIPLFTSSPKSVERCVARCPFLRKNSSLVTFVCAAVLALGAAVATPSALAQKKAKEINTEPFAAALAVPRDEMREALRAWLIPQGVSVPAPSYQIEKRIDAGDHWRWYIRYAVDEGESATGWLLVPKPLPSSGQKLPLVLALHSTSDKGKDIVVNLWPDKPKDAKDVYYRDSRGYAPELVKRGFVVFAPDRLGFGERSPHPGSKKYWETMPAALEKLRERNPEWIIAGKSVWDLQRALDFLTTIDFIDAERIASVGHSLGAWDTVMLAPMDDRIKAVVVSHTGPLRYRPGLWTREETLRQLLRTSVLKREGTEVAQNAFLMLLAPRSQLFIWSIADAYDQPPGMVDALRVISSYNQFRAREAGVPFDFTFYLHGSGHDFTNEARDLMYRWLGDRLK